MSSEMKTYWYTELSRISGNDNLTEEIRERAGNLMLEAREAYNKLVEQHKIEELIKDIALVSKYGLDIDGVQKEGDEIVLGDVRITYDRQGLNINSVTIECNGMRVLNTLHPYASPLFDPWLGILEENARIIRRAVDAYNNEKNQQAIEYLYTIEQLVFADDQKDKN